LEIRKQIGFSALRYFGALKPQKPHIAMSVTKSFTGVLAGMLVAEGTFLRAPFRSVLYHHAP
jgi:CubicO group peptidase (beta-lactamase class C family)